MKMVNVWKWQTAFTLTELMVTIVIIGSLISIGVPAYVSLVCTTKISSYTSQLHAALLLTRSEAIKRGRSINICRSSNAQTNTPTCASVMSNSLSNTGWGEGWLIYVDIDNNNVYSQGDILIQVQGTLISSITAGSIISAPNRNKLKFTSTGQTFGTFMHFAINRPESDPEASHDRYICIAAGGRARVNNSLCSQN